MFSNPRPRQLEPITFCSCPPDEQILSHVLVGLTEVPFCRSCGHELRENDKLKYKESQDYQDRKDELEIRERLENQLET